MKRTIIAVAIVIGSASGFGLGALLWHQYETRYLSSPAMDRESKRQLPDIIMTEDSNSPKVGVSGEIVVTYATFDGRPVQLVYESFEGRGEVKLRIKGKDYGDVIGNDTLLSFLMQAVVGLTGSEFPKGLIAKPSPGKTTKLGKTGYYFVYTGGYPIWGPHGTVGPDGDYSCLAFAEDATINGKDIRASGASKIVGFYGYTEYTGRK